MPVTADMQTLGVGKAQPQVWAATLGGGSQTGPRPLNKIQGMVIGPFGNGKSCLLQSNPNCFIINADGFSAHIENPQAVMWPGPGQAIEFSDIQKKVADLVAMAKKNHPRPECVALDSVSGLLAIGKSYLTKKAGKESWAEMDRKAWYVLYDMILALRNDLRAAGYGTWFISGLDKATVQMGQDVVRQAVQWPFSDTFAKDLLGLSEMVVPIAVDWNSHLDENKKVQWVGTRLVDFNDPTMTGVAKALGINERVPLEKGTGWAALEAAYNKANKL